jgi:hypothetical protein
MRSSDQCTSPPRRTPRSIFSPEFLADLDGRDGVLTEAEAAYAGPWKVEAMAGRPGRVVVLRQWEEQEAGDRPAGVFLHEDWAALLAAALPLLEREPLVYLGEEATPDGYPLIAVFGEEGPQVIGWLPVYDARLAEALHLFSAVERSPIALAALMATAGGALALAGRIVAAERPG